MRGASATTPPTRGGATCVLRVCWTSVGAWPVQRSRLLASPFSSVLAVPTGCALQHASTRRNLCMPATHGVPLPSPRSMPPLCAAATAVALTPPSSGTALALTSSVAGHLSVAPCTAGQRSGLRARARGLRGVATRGTTTDGRVGCCLCRRASCSLPASQLPTTHCGFSPQLRLFHTHSQWLATPLGPVPGTRGPFGSLPIFFLCTWRLRPGPSS
jgi:hypothetical protein